MRRYILTGAPGCGKTTILRALLEKGHAVVEEAATDVIAASHARGVAEPWRSPSFIDDIVVLQRARQIQATHGPEQFFDRSPVCTHALSVFLGYSISPALEAELDRIEVEHIYQRRVLFLDNLGFVEPTAARRISFEDSLAFERVHEECYRAFGYECVRIAARPIAERIEEIINLVRSDG